MEKTERKYYVVGGGYPGLYRSTLVSVLCQDIAEGYDLVKIWANSNFKDWNHIGYKQTGRPLIPLISVRKPVRVFVARKYI